MKKPKKKPEVSIDDWWIIGNKVVLGLCCLHGDAEGHPKFGNSPVTTSVIEDVSEDLSTVTTHSTIYKLKNPNKEREEHSLKMLNALHHYWKARNGDTERSQAGT